MTKRLFEELNLCSKKTKDECDDLKSKKNFVAKVYVPKIEIDEIIYIKGRLDEFVENNNCDPIKGQIPPAIEILMNIDIFLVFSMEHDKNTHPIIKSKYNLYEIYRK